MTTATIPTPMLARPADADMVDEFFRSEAWGVEPKIDGERRLVTITAGHVTCVSRDGTPTWLPADLVSLLGFRGSATFEFDAELINKHLVLFDMPRMGDLITPEHPLSERRAKLESLYEAWHPGDLIRLAPCMLGTEAKADLVKWVFSNRGEGVVCKRMSSTYQHGPVKSLDWRKVKQYHDVDCIVQWLGGDGVHPDKMNMGIAVMKDGHELPVGEVGRLTGTGMQAKPGDVVAVRCVYASDSDRLVQATLPRLRTDKRPDECGYDQLDHARTNRNLVLEWSNR